MDLMNASEVLNGSGHRARGRRRVTRIVDRFSPTNALRDLAASVSSLAAMNVSLPKEK
jgi:hypothetical protein